MSVVAFLFVFGPASKLEMEPVEASSLERKVSDESNYLICELFRGFLGFLIGCKLS